MAIWRHRMQENPSVPQTPLGKLTALSRPPPSWSLLPKHPTPLSAPRASLSSPPLPRASEAGRMQGI